MPGQWKPSERLTRLLGDHLAATPAVGAERAIHYTEFMKGEGKGIASPHLRMAKALADHLDRRTIAIHPGELIVGSHTEHRVGAICHVELAGFSMLEDLFRFSKRKTNPLALDKKTRNRLLREVVPYWLSRNITAKAFPFFPRLGYLKDQLNATAFVINEAGGIAHFLPDYEGLITKGTNGLRAEVRERLADPNLTADGRGFLEGALIVLAALERFADRYRDLAETLGRDDIIEVLNRVPRNPATTVREALQLIWFFQLVIQIESLDQGISLGRIDRYLAPLYVEEKAAGTLTDDGFRELIGAFAIKLSEVIPLFSERITKLFAGLPTGQAAVIGGIDEHGECAANELTFLILDVVESLPTRQPNWHARISKSSSEQFKRRVAEVVAGGPGSPAIYNDDVIIPAMARRGFPADRLWDYATVGCVEPAIPGESFTSSDAAIFNLLLPLDIVLGEGEGITRKRFIPCAGERRTKLAEIDSFEKLLDEYRAELDHQLGFLKSKLDAIERSNAVNHPTPFASLTVAGCIESAKDLTEGGARWNSSGIQGVGIADVADSFSALKSIVFDKKFTTLEHFALACRTDFAGHEKLLARIENLPKYGNGIAEVDELAAWVVACYDDLMSTRTNTRGGRWAPGGYAMTCHRAFGSHMAASPSGRRAGATLADGIAPADGRDRSGVTSSLASTLALDHTRLANGLNLNVKFDATGIEDKAALVGGIVGGYLEKGGMQIQVNMLDPATLTDAMEHPERYRNLLVRVSGYTAYFTDLTPQMQRETIARTGHRR